MTHLFLLDHSLEIARFDADLTALGVPHNHNANLIASSKAAAWLTFLARPPYTLFGEVGGDRLIGINPPNGAGIFSRASDGQEDRDTLDGGTGDVGNDSVAGGRAAR